MHVSKSCRYSETCMLIRTRENKDTCIIRMVPNGVLSLTYIAKLSGHLDNQDTFGWSQGVHNIAQVPLYLVSI